MCMKPGGALPTTTTPLEKTKSPAAVRAPGKGKAARGKKGKAGKAKPEPPEETDPRKLELLNWVHKNDLLFWDMLA